MKIIAMNLPQFHVIPENNEWWGEGFTEWTKIKNPNKYCGHIKPQNNNYYNYLDKGTMQWQAELCKKYGIYGMSYYHYYFQGKLLLEKPVENLLKWKDIDQKFCFTWANHTWFRSWQGKKDVLIEQTYGEEKDWEKHFSYLEKFFLDERYIKIDNKPLFMLFNVNVPCIDDMISLFDKKCKEIGFEGIYFVQSISVKEQLVQASDKADALMIREPSFSLQRYVLDKYRNPFFHLNEKLKSELNKKLHLKTLIKQYEGDDLMEFCINDMHNHPTDKKYFRGAFSMWDNTYRHEWRGYKISRPSKSVFEKYLRALKEDCKERGTEYVFFNAWNEWAEGMILEPEEGFGDYFLDCIRKVLREGE